MSNEALDVLQADPRSVPEFGRDEKFQKILEAVQSDSVSRADLFADRGNYQADLFPVAELPHGDAR